MPSAPDRPALLERRSLCDVAASLGPDAPTLCDPWTVADLLAHLVVRERRPDLAAGIVVPQLSDRLERGQAEVAAGDFGELVEQVRSGPPIWSPTRIGVVDEQVNLIEMYVHHEDIRRANGMGPRDLSPRLEKALGRALKRAGLLMFRSSPVGVVLEPTGRKPYPVHGRTELGEVHVTGRVGELVLVAYGRIRVADVEVTGPDAAIEALRTAEGLGFGA
jgi:uncharacterized protein (TIGR03085 family)